jgi:hypothetical protein
MPRSGILSRSTSHGIPRLLWNLKVHNPLTKNQPLNPVLSQLNPDNILTHYLVTDPLIYAYFFQLISFL